MRLKRGKIKKSAPGTVSAYRKTVPKTLFCNSCGKEVKNCGENAITVKCSVCVQKELDPPRSVMRQQLKQVQIKRARGWKFMAEYIDSEGNVFFKGEEQPKLKNTLPPTEIKESVRKVRLTKRQKEEIELKKNEMFAEIQKIKDSWVSRNVPSKLRKKDEKIIRVIEKKIKKLK